MHILERHILNILGQKFLEAFDLAPTASHNAKEDFNALAYSHYIKSYLVDYDITIKDLTDANATVSAIGCVFQLVDAFNAKDVYSNPARQDLLRIRLAPYTRLRFT